MHVTRYKWVRYQEGGIATIKAKAGGGVMGDSSKTTVDMWGQVINRRVQSFSSLHDGSNAHQTTATGVCRGHHSSLSTIRHGLIVHRHGLIVHGGCVDWGRVDCLGSSHCHALGGKSKAFAYLLQLPCSRSGAHYKGQRDANESIEGGID